MDGVVPNHGVITLATTNHSNKIDPAIADRPGRFDRIVEVGLPDKEQRYHIIRQHLKPMNVAPTVNREALERSGKNQRRLDGRMAPRSGPNSSHCDSITDERALITKEDLTASLKGRAQAPWNGLSSDPIRCHRPGICQRIRPVVNG